MISEKHITIAAKLYEMRSTAKRLFAEKYDDRVAPYRDLLRKISKVDGTSDAQACIKAMKAAADQHNGMDMMLFGAAFVEMSENA